MRVLLDECVPRACATTLSATVTRQFAKMGWAGVKNGQLLRLAATEFDALLTVDRNLEYQQNFAGVSIAVIVVHAPSNDITVLRPFMPAVVAALAGAKPGMIIPIRGQ